MVIAIQNIVIKFILKK